MTEQSKARLDKWWPVISTLLPLLLAGFVAWNSMSSRIAVLESRIEMHERNSTEVSAAVEKRLSTIESDIKELLQRK